MEEVELSLQYLTINKISRRGAITASEDEFLVKSLKRCLQNPYNSITNPEGIINLGTSTNQLMEKELEDRLNAQDMFQFRSADHQHYVDFSGIPPARAAVADFLQRHFSEGKAVDPAELVIVNGTTACLESLAFACCDQGDVMITPTPVYGRIFDNFMERALVDVQPLNLLPKATGSSAEDFELRPELLEERIKELTAAGKTVRAFILVNPQNPLGVVYSEYLVRGLMKVCAKYRMHFIIDEVYRLSIHNPDDSPFKSVLSFEDVPDPERVHFVWGLSKDFGLAGMRVGIIHTENMDMLKYLNGVSIFHSGSTIVHEMLTTLLTDKRWCDEFFVPTNQQRLKKSYEILRERLSEAEITFYRCDATMFTWINITSYMKEETEEEEIGVFEDLMAAGLYVVPGSKMYCAVSGWLRVVFSVAEDKLRVGLDRLIAVLKSRQQKTVTCKLP